MQDLRRSKGRGSIQSKGIDVEWNLLPGALALLQEVCLYPSHISLKQQPYAMHSMLR